MIPDTDGKIPFEIHTEHHIWVSDKVKQDKARRDKIDKIQTSVFTAIIWTFLSGTGAIIWYAFTTFIGDKK